MWVVAEFNDKYGDDLGTIYGPFQNRHMADDFVSRDDVHRYAVEVTSPTVRDWMQH